MVIRGETVGVIFVFRAYVAESSSNDRIVLQSFADQAAIAVHNAQWDQSVSEERQRLAAILDHSADGIMILEATGRGLRFNTPLGGRLGASPLAPIGRLHDAVAQR